MIFRSLDDNHDWNFGKGLNDYLKDNPAVGANIKTRVLSWLNDCFFDQNAGVDWLNRMGLKNQNALLTAELKNLILKSEGVVGINSLEVELFRRRFVIAFSVNTIFTKEYQSLVEVTF